MVNFLSLVCKSVKESMVKTLCELLINYCRLLHILCGRSRVDRVVQRSLVTSVC